MPACEMCGVEGNLVTAVVEGSMLQLCNRCKEFGDVIEIPQAHVQEKKPKVQLVEPEEFIVEDFYKRIKDAREEKKITQKELAEKINEKESIIHKFESNHMKPNATIAAKLERFLGIKLIEAYIPEDKQQIDFKNKALTIGDLVKLKKRE